MKKKLILFFTCLLSLDSFGQDLIAVNPIIDHYVKQEMQTVGIPGLAVAVIKNGKVLHGNTYGIANIEHNLPVSFQTAFQIASVSKLFTSTLVMKWIQEHKISLEDEIAKYLNDVPESWKNIKIKHLLAHEGGMIWPATLGGYTGTGNAKNFTVEPLEKLIASLKDSALVFVPGTKQAYQNGDYFVLQYILEHIGGKPIEQLLKSEIFSPLAMQNSGYDVEVRSFPYQLMQPIAHKSQNFTMGNGQLAIFKGFYSPASYAAGGMFLSLNDAIKWTMALDEEKFITPKLLAQITPRTAVNGGFTQMGWTIQNNEGYEMIGHSGGPGLGDIIRFPKEKLTVIVLSNYADMYPYLSQNIAKFYLENLTPQAMPKLFKRNLIK